MLGVTSRRRENLLGTVILESLSLDMGRWLRLDDHVFQLRCLGYNPRSPELGSNTSASKFRCLELVDDASEPIDDSLEPADGGITLAVGPVKLMPTGDLQR